MAHIPRWQLVSIRAPDAVTLNPDDDVISITWQCVTCAVFATEYAAPQAPSYRPHQSPEEIEDEDA